MKKAKLLFAALAFGLFTLAACTAEDLCKDCDVVVYDTDTGAQKSRTSAAEYCGDDLEEIQSGDPVVVGTDSTLYECL